jgi:hypothetical protein
MASCRIQAAYLLTLKHGRYESEVTTIILEQRQYKERMGLYPVLCELLQVDGDEAEHP